MEEFFYKIENIKLLREYFALQLNDISSNFNNETTKKLLKKKKYSGMLSKVDLSLQIIKENISAITKLIDELAPEFSNNQNSVKDDKTENINIVLENVVRLELITNLFATEFIYMIKKLESDVKNKKTFPEKLSNEVEKMKFNLKMINNYTDNIQNLINNIKTDQESVKKKAQMKIMMRMSKRKRNIEVF